MKIISLFVVLFIFLACDSSIQVDSLSEKTTGDKDEVELLGMVVGTITQNSFDITVSFSNDINLNSSGILYYCNETDSPSCDPITGDSVSTTRSSGKFRGSVSGLSSPYDAGDALNITFEVTDPDGYLSVTQFDSQINLAP